MRVVVDEGIGGTSPLWQQFQAWLGGRDAEVVWLSEVYPAMPDVEILAKLLTPDTILLTRDGVLHNRVLSQGLRSFTLNPQGQLTHKPLSLKGTWATPLPPSVLKTIQASYQHDPHPIALALSAGLPPHTLKAYRTKRRRIRSYFGSQANMARAAWTVGARLHQGHLLCGYALRIESVHGVKGLRASEAYGLDSALPPDPAQCLMHALLDVFHLHLESLRHEFFVIPTDTYELARQMVDPAGPEPSCAIHRVLRALLQALPHKAVSPCSKGWFHEQMQRKLAQLTASPGHEIVRLEVRDVVRRLGDRGAPEVQSASRQWASRLL